jgi:integrase
VARHGRKHCNRNRNRIMTGLRFLFRVTLRRLDLAAEIYHLREPRKIPPVMSTDETKRLLAVASSLKARLLLSLGCGRGLRAGEVVRLKVRHIDSAEKIIRVEQSKGRDVLRTKESVLLHDASYTFSKRMPPSSSATRLQSRVGGARPLWEPRKSIADHTFFVTRQEK